MNSWQLQEAKAKLSEVVQLALNDGPQEITLRGASAVIVISAVQFAKLKKPQSTFVQFLRHSPLIGLDLNLKRDSSLTRDVEL
jgi:antitoxin Phd